MNHAADGGDDDDDVNQNACVLVDSVAPTLKACGFHLVSRRLDQAADDNAAHARPDDLGHYDPVVAVLHLSLSTENRDCLLQYVLNGRPSLHGRSQMKKVQSVIYSKHEINCWWCRMCGGCGCVYEMETVQLNHVRRTRSLSRNLVPKSALQIESQEICNLNQIPNPMG